jgi:hypothetical protein
VRRSNSLRGRAKKRLREESPSKSHQRRRSTIPSQWREAGGPSGDGSGSGNGRAGGSGGGSGSGTAADDVDDSPRKRGRRR